MLNQPEYKNLLKHVTAADHSFLYICFLSVSGYKPTRIWEISFRSLLGEQELVGVLWGAAVQSVKDELPGLNFDLPFASKHLGFGDTNLSLLTGHFLVSLLVTSSRNV